MNLYIRKESVSLLVSFVKNPFSVLALTNSISREENAGKYMGKYRGNTKGNVREIQGKIWEIQGKCRGKQGKCGGNRKGKFRKPGELPWILISFYWFGKILGAFFINLYF